MRRHRKQLRLWVCPVDVTLDDGPNYVLQWLRQVSQQLNAEKHIAGTFSAPAVTSDSKPHGYVVAHQVLH